MRERAASCGHQPVVQAALDVEDAADPDRHHRVEHGRGAQAGVGGGKSGGEQQAQPDAVVREEEAADPEADQDGQRERQPEQSEAEGRVGSQLPGLHLRGVVEQDERQGQLGEVADRLGGELVGEGAQPVHRADRGEDDRSRHLDPAQPSGLGHVDHHDEGEYLEIGVRHGAPTWVRGSVRRLHRLDC